MGKKDAEALKNRYSMFTLSAPGYHFIEVEDTINEYKKTISDMNELLLKKDAVVSSMKEEINRLQTELGELHLQLNAIDIPDISEEEAIEVLSDFKEEVTKVSSGENTQRNTNQRKRVIIE